MEPFTVVIRIFVSAFLGGVIGFEREWHGRAAGLRTHILVSIGSTLFMLTSIGMGLAFSAHGSVDFSRIAAGVVTGIGFLGAGAIIRYGASIQGLTTAASVWTVSAIGLAVGAGMYVAAAAGSLVVVLILVLSRIEESLAARRFGERLVIHALKARLADESAVEEVLQAFGAKVKRTTIEKTPEDEQVLLIYEAIIPAGRKKEAVNVLRSLDWVEDINWA